MRVDYPLQLIAEEYLHCRTWSTLIQVPPFGLKGCKVQANGPKAETVFRFPNEKRASSFRGGGISDQNGVLGQWEDAHLGRGSCRIGIGSKLKPIAFGRSSKSVPPSPVSPLYPSRTLPLSFRHVDRPCTGLLSCNLVL